MKLVNTTPDMFISSHGVNQPDHFYRRDIRCKHCNETYYLLGRQPTPTSNRTLCPHCNQMNTKVNKIVKLRNSTKLSYTDLINLPVRR